MKNFEEMKEKIDKYEIEKNKNNNNYNILNENFNVSLNLIE